jgi:hypothetical protein
MMSNNTGYVVKILENTPPVSDEHAIGALKEQNQEADQQTRPQVKQSPDPQCQADPSGNEHGPSHPDGTKSQFDGIIAHDNTSSTQNATHNHDHVMPGDHIDDTTLQTMMQTLKESSYAPGGVANGQNNLLVIDGRHNLSETISGDQVHDNAAPTMMQALHDKTCELVGGSSGQPASQANERRDHIETPPCVNHHSNASPTMLATLQDQAYALVGASNRLTESQVHQNLNHQNNLPGIHVHDSNNPTLVATLHDQPYALVEGAVEALRKDFNADSHELASKVPGVRGAVQTGFHSGSNAEVPRDIGWHKADVEIPDPLIGGYTNGELFAFIRRFNKVGLSWCRPYYSQANFRLIRMSSMSKRCL